MDVNAQYNVAAPNSLPVRIATYQRRRMFQCFLERCDLPNPESLILDIGVTSDQSYESSNYVEAWYPHKERIIAAGIDDARFLEDLYPGMKFVEADVLDLPFEDEAFDIVHASAVLEHVGSLENQALMVAECARVARRAVFLTTPNRWFPIEFHTVLPLVHWLPKTWFRALMARTGRAFFADEENLNLMSAADLRAAAWQAGAAVPGFQWRVETVSLGGWPSNLLLTGRRA